jgi:hypothetical protein
MTAQLNGPSACCRTAGPQDRAIVDADLKALARSGVYGPLSLPNGPDAPRAVVRDARPSDAPALRPRQREPAARRPTLRETISQRRWPPPLRSLQWRVLGFQDQAGRAARTVHSQNGTRRRLSAELNGCELKGRFVGHGPFPLRVWPYGWHDRAGVAPAAPSLLLLWPAHFAAPRFMATRASS